MAIVVKKYPRGYPIKPAGKTETGFERDEYELEGWNTLERRAEKQADYKLTDMIPAPPGDIHLYACWLKKFYVNVYIVAESSQWLSCLTVKDGYSVYASEISLPQIPQWTFDRWIPSENSWNPITSDMEISAIYVDPTNLIKTDMEQYIMTDGGFHNIKYV